MSERAHGDTLVLFDVDGTLAVPAQDAAPEMVAQLARLRQTHCTGIVGAGDFEKQQRQLGGQDMKAQFDFIFSENGVHAFREGELLHLKVRPPPPPPPGSPRRPPRAFRAHARRTL
jgi:phosphomannomutase